MIQKIKGTFDIMPEEIPTWRFIEETARAVATRYGFDEIRTPTFEATELFRRGVGDTTDVVQKEMYTFLDRGDEGRSITLRPEGTASIARAIIEHGRYADAMPLKLFYIISCFRCEAPQAGRSREFFQFGTELYGTETPAADATSIAVADAVLRELGLHNIKLHINSIGCTNCRPVYREALVSYFSGHEAQLCPTCQARLKTNPLRILDCKSPICRKIAEAAPRTLDHLCPDCANHHKGLTEALDALGIAYTVDTSIVRGLDYYTRTVFEFIAEGIGAQSTVCGGGRYDGLTEQIGGPRLPGIGFAMGITRLIMAMEAAGITVPGKQPPKLYIASLGEAASHKALCIAEALRGSGLYVECDLVGRSLKAQMKYANKIGAAYTLILGDDEIASGRAMLRSMKDSTQVEIALDALAAALDEKGGDIDCTFSDLLHMQQQLYDKHRDKWTPHAPEYARNSLLWSVEELGEAIAIVKKKGDDAIMENPAVRAHYVEELCDALMYLMDNADCYGITGEELSRAYIAKFNRNMHRTWSENRAMYENMPQDKASQ